MRKDNLNYSLSCLTLSVSVLVLESKVSFSNAWLLGTNVLALDDATVEDRGSEISESLSDGLR